MEMDVTYRQAVAVWWALIWRGLLFSFVAGFVAGFIIGFVGAIVGFGHLTQPLSMAAGFLVALPVGIWVVRNVLRKKFKTFRIALVPIEQSSPAN